MSFYIDQALILDTRYVIEAHCVNGQEAFDGLYGILCTLKHGDCLKESLGLYTTADKRDAAFQAIGALVQKAQA